jgi:hypothetical protein
MSRDWSWWDAWKSGDAEASKRALDAETDRSLQRDPGRWSWGPTVSEVDAEETRRNRRPPADRRHHTGKGHVEAGESRERMDWHPREWENAKADYDRQNPRPYERWPGEDDRR